MFSTVLISRRLLGLGLGGQEGTESRGVEYHPPRGEAPVAHRMPLTHQHDPGAGGSLQLDLIEGQHVEAVFPLPYRPVAADDVLQSLRAGEEGVATVDLQEGAAEGEVVGDELACLGEVTGVERGQEVAGYLRGSPAGGGRCQASAWLLSAILASCK